MPLPSASGAGLSDIVIADRLTDANQRRIRGTSNLQVSWQLSAAGMLTCDVTLRDLKQAGLSPSGLLGRWVHYEHPTAGPWGGIITNINPGDYMVTIGAESWAVALNGLATIISGIAGPTLLGNLGIQINARRAETGIGVALFDVPGGEDFAAPEDTMEAGQDLYDQLLPTIVERWNDANGWRRGLQGAGWNVDPVTRLFRFDATYGEDRSATVALRDGRHSVGSEWADDLTDVINDVQLTAQVNTSATTYATWGNQSGGVVSTVITQSVLERATARADSVTSIARYGRRSLVLEHEAVFPSGAALSAGVLNLLNYYNQNEQLVTIRIADVDGIYRGFREGDIVYAWMPSGDAAGRMVVRHRALDVGRGVMTVSGEADLA